MRAFIPRARITGIGSLPHLDPEAAVSFVAHACPEIPFWPQLPQRSPREAMIAQVLSPVLDLLEARGSARFEIKPGALPEFRRRLRNDPAQLDEGSASGFFAFERACRSSAFPTAVALKGQITGPITLAHCLFVGDRPLADQSEICEELTAYLIRLGMWQIERLSRFDLPVLIFVDDGVMGTSPPYLLDNLKLLIQALRNAGAYTGVHCCATVTPIELCTVQPDIISFDAYLNLETFLSRPEVHSFIEEGGALAFGLVPTWHNLDSFSPSEALTRWIAAAGKYDPSRLAAASLFTATCGLGLLNVEAAHASFTRASQLSNLVRR